MRIVHSNANAEHEWQQQAMQMEKNGDLQKAAGIYRQAIKTHPYNEFPYNRLMIIYRKEKEYKKELAVIHSGIKAFQTLDHTNKHGTDKKITRLSRAILRATGLSDKKGNLLFLREPIGRWDRRREIVEKKLQKQRKSV